MNAEFITAAHRNDQDRAGKIRTFTGLYVNPLKMRSADIRIEDIAHHLSLICRYTGACPHHYSVAQHSVLVSEQMGKREFTLIDGVFRKAELQLAGLLHDAAEYVFNDIASPVKHDPRMKWYADLEHETCRMILATFGLNPDLLIVTKASDNWVFRAEVGSWYGDMDFIDRWSPSVAERRFLELFHTLKAQL